MHTFKNDTSTRLDRFLREKLELSKRESLLLLEHQLVRLNGQIAHKKHKGLTLEPYTNVQVKDFEHLLSGIIKAEPNASLEILEKGDGSLVINKAAGMPVMPLKMHETGTVLNAVIAKHPEMQGVGEGHLRSGVVHRLDNDTSGALILATNETQWQRLRTAFKTHNTVKRYRTIVQGQLKGNAQETLDLYVAQQKPAKVRVTNKAISNKTVRTCSLHWRSLETFQEASLLEVTLETGFLHQIRVMFAYKGYPVLGDKLYGNDKLELPRQMLHASYLNVLDIEANSPDPEDFQSCLSKLRSDKL